MQLSRPPCDELDLILGEPAKIAASLGASIKAAQMQVSSFGRNVTRTMNDAAIAGKKGFKGMFDNALWQGAV